MWDYEQEQQILREMNSRHHQQQRNVQTNQLSMDMRNWQNENPWNGVLPSAIPHNYTQQYYQQTHQEYNPQLHQQYLQQQNQQHIQQQHPQYYENSRHQFNQQQQSQMQTKDDFFSSKVNKYFKYFNTLNRSTIDAVFRNMLSSG
ncbi:uncharacterized protein DDB_G0285291-like [Musca vetustissima]|uniref:uncharacterized protein DDB_G0285291-like n=1 Tax=Musca vetustissima TaxID=27455 RepID=UPI002AB6D5DF|nr:uncharacterized protein DDB_G0285291-like [Musca vetustissima]